MMTRKDYVRLAEALYYNRPNTQDWSEGNDKHYHAQWVQDCAGIASALQSDNPAFDRSRFLEACGV